MINANVFFVSVYLQFFMCCSTISSLDGCPLTAQIIQSRFFCQGQTPETRAASTLRMIGVIHLTCCRPQKVSLQSTNPFSSTSQFRSGGASSQYEIHRIYADLYRITVHSFPLLTSPSTLHFEINMIYLSFPTIWDYNSSTLCWELQPQAFQTTEKFIFKTCQAQILHGRKTLFLVRQILRLLQLKGHLKKTHPKLGKVSSFNHAWQQDSKKMELNIYIYIYVATS